ncbi:Gfo/Idh/MocA family oxidoreductase [Microlunatus panaciterrae]|uniref:Dehydrogenase n=1 Tax=Microlunatus panaciterrae TaxID=400768 RepID=A0ABS2RGB0_9ACTN|nr:Gfo/Idh/MocA family oxidoreductase [Microlunatus panaciterrae]MBM7798044.1 putative dehydrogenase [Microlunatus panaciterrae]
MPTAAVVGCGDVSSVHFEAIAKNPAIDLVAVVDTDPERRAASSAAYGVPGFGDHREMITAISPDAVHICTPHHQHVPVAVDCLEAGVNVIMEKPLAHTMAEGDRLIAVAEQTSAKIAVCFQNRYNAAVQALRERLDSGDVGQVIGASATVIWHRTADYYRSRDWRGRWETSGGGLLINQAIHTLDLLQWLVGDVTEVRGHAATHALAEVIEVEDTAEIVLKHVNGVQSVFYATLANAVNSPITVDIATEKATLSLRGDLTITHLNGDVEVVSERLAESGGRAYWGVSHELLINDFYEQLDDPNPFWISPREAGKSLRILKDVYDQSYPNFGFR